MKQLLFTCLLWGTTFITASAQQRKIHSDPALAENFMTMAANNADYVRMRNELAVLVNTATPTNTHAAEVRALLAKNTALLKELYNKAEIEAPVVKRGNMPTTWQFRPARTLSQEFAKFRPLNPLLKVITPPYWGKWINPASQNDMKPDTSLSNRMIGKLAFTFTSDNWGEPMGIGPYGNMFRHPVTVPSDPTVIAAEIKLEYSFLYTGWDTYGSIRGLYLVVRTEGLQEQYNNNPFPTFLHGPGSYFPPYRIAATLHPVDSIKTDFDDFISSGSDSLILQRYVVPGQNFTIELGPGFEYKSKRGSNGCYHYGEMILKKITIRYLKANQN